jgi:hypothetical protein
MWAMYQEWPYSHQAPTHCQPAAGFMYVRITTTCMCVNMSQDLTLSPAPDEPMQACSMQCKQARQGDTRQAPRQARASGPSPSYSSAEQTARGAQEGRALN